MSNRQWLDRTWWVLLGMARRAQAVILFWRADAAEL
jgi:hypothetical protein